MADFSLRLDPSAIASLRSTAEARALLAREGTAVRDRARANARPISAALSTAISTEAGADEEGAFVDVGYDKSNPGFALWWTEVGTVDQPARPHLRPAVRPGS